MKFLRPFLLLVALATQVILATGCANTARGIRADTANAADKVEDAVD